MTISRIDLSPELRRTGRRFGYGIAVAVNLVLLVAVQFILEWGWLPFLSAEFDTVVPWISLSLFASILANLVYQFNEAALVKSTGQILLNLISLFVSYQVYSVFPFDFSAYDFNWALLTRLILILAMVGGGVGVIAETVRLVQEQPRTS